MTPFSDLLVDIILLFFIVLAAIYFSKFNLF